MAKRCFDGKITLIFTQESRISALQETYTLAVVGTREHVDRAELLDFVAGVLERHEVAGEALRLAGHVDQALDCRRRVKSR